MIFAATSGYLNAIPNNIYYRAGIPSPADAVRIATDISAALPSEPPFSPTVMAVITWFAVGPYGNAELSSTSALNTYQASLAAGGNRTFVTLW